MTKLITQKFGLLAVSIFFFVTLTPNASADCIYKERQYSSEWCKEFLSANINNSYQVFYQASEPFPATNYQYNNVYNPYPTISYNQQIQLLLKEVARLQALLIAQNSNTYYPNTNYTYNTSNVLGVSTNGANGLDRDEAILRGSVRLNRNQRVEVWFEYGTSQYSLTRTTSKETLDYRDDENFSRRVSGLYDDTTYYFRAVARDNNGRVEHGAIYSFRTDDDYYYGNNRNNDEPDVTTGSVTDIERSSARVSGSVDMNDYNDGNVFFVFGQNEDEVDDVDRDYDSYNDIRVRGEDLAKVLIDANAKGRETYTRNIHGLERNMRYYYRLCVDFDEGRNDTAMVCGNVRDFRTD